MELDGGGERIVPHLVKPAQRQARAEVEVVLGETLRRLALLELAHIDARLVDLGRYPVALTDVELVVHSKPIGPLRKLRVFLKGFEAQLERHAQLDQSVPRARDARLACGVEVRDLPAVSGARREQRNGAALVTFSRVVLLRSVRDFATRVFSAAHHVPALIVKTDLGLLLTRATRESGESFGAGDWFFSPPQPVEQTPIILLVALKKTETRPQQ